MPRYYKHKPYWARPEDWVTRKPSGAKQPVRPVLEATRQPSGEFAFSGEVYNPPATNDAGRRRGRSVPNSRPSGMDAFRKINRMKSRMAGYSAKFNMAMAMADLIGDPEQQRKLLDYGWDEFMRGELPPPFDWLNPEIPPEWLPTKTPGESKPLPPGSTAYQGPDGLWYGVQPAFSGEAHMDRDPIGVPTWFPPPGKAAYPTGGKLKWSLITYSSYPWASVNEDLSGKWTATYHDFTHTGAPTTPAWSRTVRSYTNRLEATQLTGNVIVDRYYRTRVVGKPAPGAPELNPDRNVVTVGATEYEALNPGAPSRTVMTPLPAPYRWAHPYANLIKQINGTKIVEFGETDPVNQGGTKQIFEPGGPVYVVPTKPGEPQHPPGKGTKEKKRLVGGGAFFFTQKVFHAITEYQDLLDALLAALPEDLQKQAKKLRGPVLKSAFLWTHLDKVDIGDAIVEVAWNQFEDYVIGTQLFARNKRAAEARGDRYAFRTLNSANGYGGLEDLGKLYGEFSKEYVNPRKEDLKRFLTEKFGI